MVHILVVMYLHAREYDHKFIKYKTKLFLPVFENRPKIVSRKVESGLNGKGHFYFPKTPKKTNIN